MDCKRQRKRKMGRRWEWTIKGCIIPPTSHSSASAPPSVNPCPTKWQKDKTSMLHLFTPSCYISIPTCLPVTIFESRWLEGERNWLRQIDQSSNGLPGAYSISKEEAINTTSISIGKNWKNSLFRLADAHNSHNITSCNNPATPIDVR